MFWVRKQSIQDQLNLFNVNTCPYEYLPYLGWLVGVDFNYDLEERYARAEIANAIAFYKTKGTEQAVYDFVRNITGWKSTLVLQEGFAFFTNTIGHWTINVNDPTAPMPLPSAYSPFIGGQDDIVKYTFGGFKKKYGLTSYWLILNIPEEDISSAAKINKLTRIKDDLVPITGVITDIIGVTFFSDAYDHVSEVTEDYDSTDIQELTSYLYSHGPVVYNDSVVGMSYIISNTLTFTNSALNWTPHTAIQDGYGFVPA
jgi:hypothetical protein